MAGFRLWLVHAHGGGFRPRAETFGSDGADVEAEELADGEAGEVEADGAVGDSGEGFPPCYSLASGNFGVPSRLQFTSYLTAGVSDFSSLRLEYTGLKG